MDNRTIRVYMITLWLMWVGVKVINTLFFSLRSYSMMSHTAEHRALSLFFKSFERFSPSNSYWPRFILQIPITYSTYFIWLSYKSIIRNLCVSLVLIKWRNEIIDFNVVKWNGLNTSWCLIIIHLGPKYIHYSVHFERILKSLAFCV